MREMPNVEVKKDLRLPWHGSDTRATSLARSDDLADLLRRALALSLGDADFVIGDLPVHWQSVMKNFFGAAFASQGRAITRSGDFGRYQV